MFVSRQIIDISNQTSESQAGDSQCLAGNFETIKIPQVNYGSVKHASAHGLAQCHSFTLIIVCNKRRFGKSPRMDRVYGASQMSGEALHENSGSAPDRHSYGFCEKEEERPLRVCSWCRRGGP